MKTAMAVALLAALALAAPWGGSARAQGCEPTRPDMLGPFYKAGAPERFKVGEGYVLTGRVLSAGDCSPLEGARIELWLVGPGGRYDDAHRATVFSGGSGSYRFESNFPPGYYGRPPHIHIRASAEGHRTLVTQHYPERGSAGASFDLVLIPER
ncbi:MAG: intradiol ring-cleavage dioxygenase [Nitrospirota bacterium]|jgi:protocatechuate 3,4-dioxygenase beta subunit